MDGTIKIEPTTYAYIGAFKAWYRLKYNKEYDLKEDDKVYFYNIRKSTLFENFNHFLAVSRDCDYKTPYEIALAVGLCKGLLATNKVTVKDCQI